MVNITRKDVPIVFMSGQELALNGRFLKMSQALRGAGYSVSTLLLSPSEARLDHSRNIILRKNFGTSKLGRALSYRLQKRAAIKFLKHNNSQIYHAMDYISLDIAASAKKVNGGRVIFDACEIFTDTALTTPKIKKYVKKIFNKCAQQIDCVLTPSTYLNEHYQNSYPGWPVSRIISNASFLPKSVAYDGRLHQAVQVGLDHKILLYHGGFSEKRGLETLVQTASDLPEDYSVALLGYGVLEPALRVIQKTTNERAGRNVVHILPPVPHSELFKWMVGAEWGLIPYEDGPLNHRFCTPNKLYEYPAAGVPIITTPLLSLQTTIENYAIGYTVPNSMTGKSLSKVVRGCDSKARKRLIKTCLKFSNEKCFDKEVRDLLYIYADLEKLFLKGNMKGEKENAAFMAKNYASKGQYQKALPYLRQLEMSEDAEINFILGVMHQTGLEMDVSILKAHNYYEAAANAGHKEAAFNLGVLYQAGVVGDGSFETARAWYRRAQVLGHPQAWAKIQEVLSQLDPELAGLKRVDMARMKPRTGWDRLIGRR